MKALKLWIKKTKMLNKTDYLHWLMAGCHLLQKQQPSRGVLRENCSNNMLQIYRRTPIPECDFNKVALQLYWNHTSAWVLSCKFTTYFQKTFLLEHLWRAVSLTLWNQFSPAAYLGPYQTSIEDVFLLKQLTTFSFSITEEILNEKLYFLWIV